jgi:hypothetical protein
LNEFHSIILDERCLSTFCIFEIHNVYFNTMYSSSLDKRSFGSETKSNKKFPFHISSLLVFVLNFGIVRNTTAKQIVSSKTTTRNKTILTCPDLKSRVKSFRFVLYPFCNRTLPQINSSNLKKKRNASGLSTLQ